MSIIQYHIVANEMIAQWLAARHEIAQWSADWNTMLKVYDSNPKLQSRKNTLSLRIFLAEWVSTLLAVRPIFPER